MVSGLFAAWLSYPTTTTLALVVKIGIPPVGDRSKIITNHGFALVVYYRLYARHLKPPYQPRAAEVAVTPGLLIHERRFCVECVLTQARTWLSGLEV